jgi:hypothetical protein
MIPAEERIDSEGIEMDDKLRKWIQARNRHHLNHAQVQMARELGLNPERLGKLDNHDQEPWKEPLPRFIECLYLERFGRREPPEVLSIEDRDRRQRKKKEAKREAKRNRLILPREEAAGTSGDAVARE